MYQVLGAALLIWIANKLFGESTEVLPKISKRSNCSDEFIRFSKNLDLTSNKKRLLRDAKNTIIGKVTSYFEELEWRVGKNVWTAKPTFFIQGSFKHGTAIRTQDDSCDIDLGVYIDGKPPILPRAFKQHLYKALEGHTNIPVSIRNKCVRIQYSNLFHIDLPLYYHDSVAKKTYLASGEDWVESDPKGFSKWFLDRTRSNEQTIRVIKYFKAWANNIKTKRSQRMPSGIALTIWVLTFFEKHNRDDIAFIKTACKILEHLGGMRVSEWECSMPVRPNDNLIAKLSGDQRNNFIENLRQLITESCNVLDKEDKQIASAHWKRIFGKWFTM